MQKYFGEKKISENVIKLYEEDFNHIKNVMRMKYNDEILVVLDNISYLSTLNDDLKSVTIVKEDNKNICDNGVILYVPVLNEIKMRMILEKSTELGVKKIIPIYFNRCKFKINKDKEDKMLLRWRKIVREASMQSHRNNIPEIGHVLKLKDIKSLTNVNILCSTDNTNVNNVKKVLNNVNNSDIIQVVFGPEGGITNNEQDYLVDLGFIKTTFGDRILRTETVPLYILSIINFMKMEK